MSGPWLEVVGIGEDGLAGLGEAARRVVAEADWLIGGRRHLALVGPTSCRTMTWDSPLVRTLDRLAELRGRRCVVLASGDPLWFGIGSLLRRRFAADELRFHPAVSAFSLAAARLAWPLEGCACLSVHGRPLDLLRRHLAPGARLLVLSEDGATPARVVALLAQTGFADGELIVLERLGGPAERVHRLPATAPAGECADLNLVAIDLSASKGSGLSTLPGLPDDAFEHDGQLTRSDIRAMALARLAPLPGELLWDVGAGSGAVAIEWCRAVAGARAIAVERDPTRAARIEANARRLGVPELRVVIGEAPACLEGLAPPDAVFVGGGVRERPLLDRLWGELRPGGRLVAHAVTLEAERTLLDLQAATSGELTRLALARAEPVGRLTGWRPSLPVTRLAARKPCAPAG